MSLIENTKRFVRFSEGNHVYLRPISMDDVDFYYEKLFDSEVRKLTGTQNNFTREWIHQYIDRKTQDPSNLLFLIAMRETDEVIGDIALQDLDLVNRNANIRISIDSGEHRGKGLGKEALVLLLDYGFGIKNLHRIELEVFAYNERAIRAYEKVGFKREGIKREVLYYDHQYHDAITMSMLENEFRALYVNK